jgi:hypothetical protein
MENDSSLEKNISKYNQSVSLPVVTASSPSNLEANSEQKIGSFGYKTFAIKGVREKV